MLTLEEERKKVVEAINATFSHLGAGLTDLLTDRSKLGAAVAGATLLALGVYSTREGVRVAGRTFDRWFGTPRLVRRIVCRCQCFPPFRCRSRQRKAYRLVASSSQSCVAQ